jgi:high-affinity iron transporter
MGATFVVTLREAFEAALLLGIVYTYLDRVQARAHAGWVTLGAVGGLVASVAMGIAVSYLSGPLLDLGPDLVAAGVMFLAAAALTWHGWWMGRHAGEIQGVVLRQVDDAQAGRRVWALALIAFTGVFREGAETVLFLWGLLSQAAVAGWSGAIAGTLGVATAAGLGWLVFRGARRVPLRYFFAGTSALLLLVAAGLVSAGVGRLEGLGFLPPSPTAWDTSWLLDDRSLVGSFLGGLVGYRARPSILEALIYVLWLGVTSMLVLTPPRMTPATGQHSSSR